MDLATLKPVRYILPTQHVMEDAYCTLHNRYVPQDVLLVVYLKYHRDVMNQEGNFFACEEDLFEEYADELQDLVLKFNRHSKFGDFVDLLQSSTHEDVVMGYHQIRFVCRELFDKLKNVEYFLGEILARTLPDAFYNYHCEPIQARLYAGDLAIIFNPIRALGVVDAIKPPR